MTLTSLFRAIPLRTLACVATAFSVAPLLPLSPAHAATGRTLACAGPFAADSSHERLVQAFGKQNVARQMVPMGEGQMTWASVAFATDKRNRIEIVWSDERTREHPMTITVRNGSIWRLGNGIALGMPLGEIERKNGKPFKIAGFDWDYGGTAVDWEGGALARLTGGCTLLLHFEAARDAPADAHDKVLGDKNFSSGDPNMRAVKPTVRAIILRYGE